MRLKFKVFLFILIKYLRGRAVNSIRYLLEKHNFATVNVKCSFKKKKKEGRWPLSAVSKRVQNVHNLVHHLKGTT